MSALLLCAGCASEPQPLPSAEQAAEADAEMDHAAHPPLTQLLYDYAFLPKYQRAQQRVRLLIWIRHMDLGAYQLRALAELAETARQERARIEQQQLEIVMRYEPEIAQAYELLWRELSAGTALDDPALEEAAAVLLDARKEHARSEELLALRVAGVRAVLEAERPWLATLSPKQEALLSDALFLLRHRLDPYANPGDFRALVGTVFSAGDYGTLTRGSFTPEDDQLDLARLWSDYKREDINGPVFSDARRELILYMVLLEPALPEAIAAALGEAPPPAGEPPPSEGEPAGAAPQ
ncbi:MAG: hypothetical protein H6739_33285 [Alphaproteobacteria bacterium]|nr:hypothetical protein [Alphaproteobacteria bacterium]